MLLTLVEIKRRMLNCKPAADVSITFCEEDMVRLSWDWTCSSGKHNSYHVDVFIHHISVSCRSFERQMHKAKRFMKHQAEV